MLKSLFPTLALNLAIGLQRASSDQPPYTQGLRWQFELETPQQIDEIIATCQRHRLQHEVTTERGGDRFLTRLVSVTSPSEITVWFEGPNEATADQSPDATP